jgi:hypothetical protein
LGERRGDCASRRPGDCNARRFPEPKTVSAVATPEPETPSDVPGDGTRTLGASSSDTTRIVSCCFSVDFLSRPPGLCGLVPVGDNSRRRRSNKLDWDPGGVSSNERVATAAVAEACAVATDTAPLPSCAGDRVPCGVCGETCGVRCPVSLNEPSVPSFTEAGGPNFDDGDDDLNETLQESALVCKNGLGAGAAAVRASLAAKMITPSPFERRRRAELAGDADITPHRRDARDCDWQNKLDSILRLGKPRVLLAIFFYTGRLQLPWRALVAAR